MGRVRPASKPAAAAIHHRRCLAAPSTTTAEQHERCFRVAHDEHVRGRQQVHEPYGAACEILVAALAQREPIHDEPQQQCADVGHEEDRERRVEAR